jgi:hypothetical protein
MKNPSPIKGGDMAIADLYDQAVRWEHLRAVYWANRDRDESRQARHNAEWYINHLRTLPTSLHLFTR